MDWGCNFSLSLQVLLLSYSPFLIDRRNDKNHWKLTHTFGIFVNCARIRGPLLSYSIYIIEISYRCCRWSNALTHVTVYFHLPNIWHLLYWILVFYQYILSLHKNMVCWRESMNDWSLRLIEHEHVEEYINKRTHISNHLWDNILVQHRVGLKYCLTNDLDTTSARKT